MSVQSNEEFIVCHECDQLYRVEPLDPGAKASCQQCGAFLYKHIPDSINRSLALYLAALMLFLIANCFPFMALKLGGRVEENILISGSWALYKLGMPDLSVLVFLTSVGFPAFAIAGMLYLLIPAWFGRLPPAAGPVYRVVYAITPWSLVGVFMLGVLIAFVKLQDIATVIAGTSVYALAVLLIIYTAARANFDPRALWALSPLTQPDAAALTAPGSRWLNCHYCGFVHGDGPDLTHCRRCDGRLHYRKENSINKTWALLMSAAILLVPANVYPVMTVIRFGQGAPNTILGGIIHLIEEGMWGLAMIVFVASIVVPILKLILLTFLLISIKRKSDWRPRDRTLLYRITEVVGAWSMVDIFLVGLLSALVSLDALSTIRPGIGATFFGAVVVLTMFAAHSFDPRLIWDTTTNNETEH